MTSVLVRLTWLPCLKSKTTQAPVPEPPEPLRKSEPVLRFASNKVLTIVSVVAALRFVVESISVAIVGTFWMRSLSSTRFSVELSVVSVTW